MLFLLPGRYLLGDAQNLMAFVRTSLADDGQVERWLLYLCRYDLMLFDR
jgi:hypothetical protein